MEKSALFHQVAWSIVPPGNRTERVEIPGVAAEVTFMAPGAAGAAHSGLAHFMEGLLGQALADVPEDIDLTGDHYDRVVGEVSRICTDVAGAMLVGFADGENPVDEMRDTMLGKLRELAEAEGRKFEDEDAD